MKTLSLIFGLFVAVVVFMLTACLFICVLPALLLDGVGWKPAKEAR